MLRASLAGSPFCFRLVEHLPADGEADLVVVPANRPGHPAPGSPPRIATGPASLMRAALLAGCADYLREPWTPEELALRAEGVLARQVSRLQFPWGAARWDGDRLRTPRGTVELTRRQAVILRALLRHRGEPVPRAALAGLLGPGAGRRSRRVDVHVSAIRRLVRAVEPAARGLVVCVRGRGYMVR
jgi:two-component system phosphate regulon response regulator PhoB